jgi:hypothetical protein
MKTVEPSFAVLLYNLYPILTRYKTFVIENNELKEVEKIMIQFKDRIIDCRSDQVTILNFDQVRKGKYKNKLEYFKYVLLLDDEFYPDSDIVRIGLNKSISDIKTIQDKISVDIDNANIGGLKWPTYKEVENYIKSSPNNYIELTKK